MLGFHKHGHGIRFRCRSFKLYLFRRGTSSGREWVFDTSLYAKWNVRVEFWKAG